MIDPRILYKFLSFVISGQISQHRKEGVSYMVAVKKDVVLGVAVSNVIAEPSLVSRRSRRCTSTGSSTLFRYSFETKGGRPKVMLTVLFHR